MTARTSKHSFVALATVAVLLLASQARTQSRLQFPGPAPGEAQARAGHSELVLENKALSCTWDVSKGRLTPGRVADKLSGDALALGGAECFELVLDDGRIVKASDLRITGALNSRDIRPDPKSCRLAQQSAGKQITVVLTSPDEDLTVQWHGILRDGSNYVRQQITFTAKNKTIKLKEIVL